jgi:hypothetical protein
MAWQLDQFLAEKVERGRKLLAESEEHRGSTDLQVRAGWAGSGGLAAAAAAGCPAVLLVLAAPQTSLPHPPPPSQSARRCLLTRWTSQWSCTAPSCGATASRGRA